MKQADITETASDLRDQLNVSLTNNGIAALSNEDAELALTLFERAHALSQSPTSCSFLGYCLARTGGETDRALALCQQALRQEPNKPVHYLNLGRVQVLAGNKKDAIKTFYGGLRYGENSEIRKELNALGTKKRPLLSFLKWSNPINKHLGITLKKLGLR